MHTHGPVYVCAHGHVCAHKTICMHARTRVHMQTHTRTDMHAEGLWLVEKWGLRVWGISLTLTLPFCSFWIVF